jgi:hypothetical protein
MLEGLTPPKNRSVYCKVADVYATLDESDRKILQAAVDDVDTWGARTLSTALRNRGLSMADTTITKHRNKGCACYRD